MCVDLAAKRIESIVIKLFHMQDMPNTAATINSKSPAISVATEYRLETVERFQPKSFIEEIESIIISFAC